MKRPWLLLSLGLAVLPVCATAATPGFSVTATDAPAGRFMPKQYSDSHGCTGHNTSPTIAWQGGPATAKSYAITIFDRDANGGKGFWHWLATGIPATAKGLESGASGSPAMTAIGVSETANDFGGKGYGGPCPPPGQDHRYVVTLYALDTVTLELPPATAPADAAAAIRGHAIGQAETTLRASR
ncbi:YbhB/YbcL family Raf kinase inhibitor-like protein [Asticcacaulis solisilvae]|uniref:YbhB/YbcL family Raf kinase inhibitor-like protein n=1 Tax=Asticcacaulis solisilvae TaxID=1217274 RepID=UPI003FD8E865